MQIQCMPRRLRFRAGGRTFHVLNQAVGRRRLFAKEADYLAFENVTRDPLVRQPTGLLSYCVMPNHWHMVYWGAYVNGVETEAQAAALRGCVMRGSPMTRLLSRFRPFMSLEPGGRRVGVAFGQATMRPGISPECRLVPVRV